MSIDLNWMSGVWTADVWGGRMEEHWTAQTGGTLVGMNRLVSNGLTSHVEFLSIEAGEVETSMAVILPQRYPLEPIRYVVSDHGERRVTFANPEHGRLHTINYEREGDRMECRIEGERHGSPYRATIRFSPLLPATDLA